MIVQSASTPVPAAAPALEIDDITLRYGGLVALEHVSLQVAEGEIVGLIGPNGAGKTSLTNVVTGLARPTTGDVRFYGESIVRLPPFRRGRLGMARTFQIVRPLIGMSVLENVIVGAAFGRGGRGISNREVIERASAALDRVGLRDRANLPVEQLTLANRQMLELARVLAGDPRILIVDEVMAGSNASELSRKIELLRALNRDGLTLIVIEHVMKAVMALSHRIVVLHHGELLADGPPEVVTRNPQVLEAYLGTRFHADAEATAAEVGATIRGAAAAPDAPSSGYATIPADPARDA